jgi:TolB protein
VLALLTAVVLGTMGQSAPPPAILMTSVRTGDTEVVIADPRFGDIVNVTRSPASQDRYPMWSPDGRDIVFTSDRRLHETFDLYRIRVGGTTVRTLTKVKPGGTCYFPTWSGGLIYFGFDPGDGTPAVIARVPANGGDMHIVGPGRDPAISPDGRTVAFTDRLERGYVVFLMPAQGGPRRQLTAHQNEIGAVTPTWSPDGTRILYSDQVGEGLELFVVDVRTGVSRQLTRLEAFATSPSWSPDQSLISFRVTDEAYWRRADARTYAYQEKRADKRPLWTMKADGSDAHVVETLRFVGAIDGSRGAWRPR